MEFLIDRKFWNNVIKKADPTMALEIKKALKKKDDRWCDREPDLKKELILRLSNISHIFKNSCFLISSSS